MSAPLGARVRTEVAAYAADGTPLCRMADDQVWSALCADRAWLRAADVVSVREADLALARRRAEPPDDDAALSAAADLLADCAPACRVIAVAAPRPTVIVRGGSGAAAARDDPRILPARSGWDARLLGAVAHVWLSAGLAVPDLAAAWSGRVIAGFQAAEGRRCAAVSLRLGEGAARCTATMLC